MSIPEEKTGLYKLVDWIKLLNKLIRPILPITGGLSAWLIARACQADMNTALAAGVTIALSSIGASFWHYAQADEMYARKIERLDMEGFEVIGNGIKKPKVIKALVFIGLVMFCLSIGIAHEWLPKPCTYILLFNTITIAAYSAWLAKKWFTKNLVMAVVSATPIIIGWWSGTTTHRMVPWAVAVAAIAHLSHEIIKDVMDIKANEGIRVTLPMVITPPRALQLSGALLFPVQGVLVALLQFADTATRQSLIGVAVTVFLITGLWLIILKRPGVTKTAINAGLCVAILAFL